MYLILSIFVSIINGVLIGIFVTRRLFVFMIFVLIFLIANFFECLPYFTNDPKTWRITYITGLFHAGLVYLVLDIAPAFISYVIVKKIKK